VRDGHLGAIKVATVFLEVTLQVLVRHVSLQELRPSDLPGSLIAKRVDGQAGLLQVLVQRQLLLLQPLASPLQRALDFLGASGEAVFFQVGGNQPAVDQLPQGGVAQRR
jgi:hypothetical protein